MAETVILTKEFLDSFGAGKQDSIELTRGAKGNYQWNVKIYSKDLLTESFKVQEEIQKIDAELRKRYGEQQ